MNVLGLSDGPHCGDHVFSPCQRCIKHHSPRLKEDFILSPWNRWKSRLFLKFSRNRSSSSFPSLLLLRLLPCMDWTVAKVGRFASQTQLSKPDERPPTHVQAQLPRGSSSCICQPQGPHPSWSWSWSAPALCPCISSP